MAEESSKALFQCEKEVGEYVTRVIRRYGTEKDKCKTDEELDHLMEGELHAVDSITTKKYLDSIPPQANKEERHLIYRELTNRMLACHSISNLLKRLLQGKIDIPEFIERAEKKLAMDNELNRMLNKEIDEAEYAEWMYQNGITEEDIEELE